MQGNVSPCGFSLTVNLSSFQYAFSIFRVMDLNPWVCVNPCLEYQLDFSIIGELTGMLEYLSDYLI